MHDVINLPHVVIATVMIVIGLRRTWMEHQVTTVAA